MLDNVTIMGKLAVMTEVLIICHHIQLVNAPGLIKLGILGERMKIGNRAVSIRVGSGRLSNHCARSADPCHKPYILSELIQWWLEASVHVCEFVSLDMILVHWRLENYTSFNLQLEKTNIPPSTRPSFVHEFSENRLFKSGNYQR